MPSDGCDQPGDRPAPKSPNSPERWYFCEAHAAEYNRNWNYFEGLSAEEAAASSVVKVACAFPRGVAVAPALYFSRNLIPSGEGPHWHHIGVYAYRRPALARFVALPEGALEKREKLEQLRALEAGMRIGVVRVDHAPFGVDTQADLERARRTLAA